MNSPSIGIGKLIKENPRFFIPSHQRDYSWTEDQVRQLLEDVEAAIQNEQDDYFIGLMVLMPDGEGYRILDGQQRLSTSIVIFSAIRTWLQAHNHQQDANQIQQNFIASRELGGEEHHPVLVLNQENNPFFETYVVSDATNVEVMEALSGMRRYDPSRKLLEGILICREYIDSIANRMRNEDRTTRHLFDLMNYFENHVKVVTLVVPSESNAYTVFETLNARGLDLSVLDLVKNHVFGRITAPAQLRDTEARWAQMMVGLQDVPADEFLKAWWTTRHGRVQSSQLFPQFREAVPNARSAVQVSSDLLSSSVIYAALESPDDPIWSEANAASRLRLRALKLLGAAQVKPVLLAALEKFSTAQLNRLLHLLEVLIVRYQFIGGGRTGRLEIGCANLAHQIYLENIRTAAAARNLLRDLLPTDEEFRDSFTTKQERNTQKVRYLFSELEIQARRQRNLQPLGDELRPLDSLTVEHILPKNPAQEWRQVLIQDPQLQEDCTYRLGNMCLLTGVNRHLGNQPYEQKRPVFDDSHLELTRSVADFATWDRGSINERQANLAALAVAYWRFD